MQRSLSGSFKSQWDYASQPDLLASPRLACSSTPLGSRDVRGRTETVEGFRGRRDWWQVLALEIQMAEAFRDFLFFSRAKQSVEVRRASQPSVQKSTLPTL
jgi:hypothetical protein